MLLIVSPNIGYVYVDFRQLKKEIYYEDLQAYVRIVHIYIG